MSKRKRFPDDVGVLLARPPLAVSPPSDFAGVLLGVAKTFGTMSPNIVLCALLGVSEGSRSNSPST